MDIAYDKFVGLVEEAFDSLSEEIKSKLHNVVILVDDQPTNDQLAKISLGNGMVLFGLFEGRGQASGINFGPVLPDRITIFREAICNRWSTVEEIRSQILSTLKHEIAHHFGLGEDGARRASLK